MASVEAEKTLREALTSLLQRRLLDDEGLARITQHLAKRKPHHGEPWFVKFLLAIGAWVAALCFVACLGIANLIDDDGWTLLGWGGAFVVAATVLRRGSEHIFPVQLALAVSSMGHGFVIAAAAELSRGSGALASASTASIVLCLVLYSVYPDNLHRFLSCLVAAGFLTAWIVEGEGWHLDVAL